MRFSIVLLLAVTACGTTRPRESDAGIDQMGIDGSSVLPETTLTAVPPDLDNNAVVQFEFESDVAGADFMCSVDGAEPSSCSSPHEVTIPEGPHSFSVFAVASGSEDLTPATHQWTADLTAPDTTIVVAPAALDNSVTVTFEFTVDEVGATTTCQVDGGALAPCTSPHVVDNLTDGTHELIVTATDPAGNVEVEPARHAWTIDTAAPDTLIDRGPSGAVSSVSAEFSFYSPDAGAGATFECAVDGASFAACTAPHELSGLVEGAHSFQVRVVDQTGNVDPTPATRGWTVDTIAPTANVTSGPNGPTADATPSFSFTVAGAPTEVECRMDSGAYAACTSPHTPAALSDGTHMLSVRATDAAGNAGVGIRAFIVDTVGPVVTITFGASGPVSDTTPTFSFTAEAGAAFECSVDGGSFGSCVSSYTTPSLSQGAHSFAVRAFDGVGNGSSTQTRNFVVDTVIPTVTILSGPAQNQLWASATVPFTFSAADANLVSVQCRIYELGTSAPAYQPCTSPVSFSVGGGSNIRTLRFQIRAQDAVGYVRTISRTFQQGVPAG